MSPLGFTVLGQPVPQGSKRAFARTNAKGKAFATLVDVTGAGLKSWRNGIAYEARQALRQAERDPDGFRASADRDVPYRVTLRFTFARPKSVKRVEMTVKPDIDKLARAALDALTGLVWLDDCQVISLVVQKAYLPAGLAPSRLDVIVSIAEYP